MVKFEIIHIDEDIIVVNKPAGLLTIGDRFTFNIPSLLSQLRKKYEEVYTVHRLDKDTSGIVIFARNAEAHRNLSMQFEQKDVHKKYVAFVEGATPQEGTIDEPIAESPHVKGKMVVYKKGKPSTTNFKTSQTYGNVSEVDIELLTGRTHQIRVHMAYIGHPLFIDPNYGTREEFFLSEFKGRKFKLSKDKKEKPFITRLTLHSYSLTINHPTSGDKITFECDIPKDLRALKNQLTKLYGDK